ncbi:hypothetical protein B0H10DRAFT_2193364 [Mycena sp. CBHHK59/15]|nr:hypothetical protein B0H10DRAFT_2193364 [Mycena sp. CBHHK59/15]
MKPGQLKEQVHLQTRPAMDAKSPLHATSPLAPFALPHAQQQQFVSSPLIRPPVYPAVSTVDTLSTHKLRAPQLRDRRGDVLLAGSIEADGYQEDDVDNDLTERQKKQRKVEVAFEIEHEHAAASQLPAPHHYAETDTEACFGEPLPAQKGWKLLRYAPGSGAMFRAPSLVRRLAMSACPANQSLMTSVGCQGSSAERAMDVDEG